MPKSQKSQKNVTATPEMALVIIGKDNFSTYN